MLVTQRIIDAINEQIGMEFGASMQYEAISAHFAYEALLGLSAHFAQQAAEERDHAHRFMKFVNDAGGRVMIPGIQQPVSTFSFAKDAVKISLDHELKVTAAINNLMKLAVEESDHITQNMLQWFLKEQVEEVSSMDELLKIVERAGETNLLLVEQYLATGRKPYGGRPSEGGEE
jgi:ferritin